VNFLGQLLKPGMQILALVALTIYIYYPFISQVNIGNRDAQYYQYMLHDSIEQLQNGFFPAYVGQSIFSPYGTPVIAGSLYLLVGQFLNFITFNVLSTLFIQHLTIIFIACISSILLYFAIRRLAPTFQWKAVVLVFLYISSPGVLAFAYSLDAYPSHMALPFVPLIFLYIVDLSINPKPTSFLIVAMLSSLLFLAHPIIAAWTMVFAVLFISPFIFLQKIHFYPILITAIIFICLSAWQFIGIIQLTEVGNNLGDSGPKKQAIEILTTVLLKYIPDAFLPLSMGKSELSFLQLGYSLWAILFFSLLIFIRKHDKKLQIYALIFLDVILILLLFPIFKISHFIWNLFPYSLISLTTQWPNLRLYILFSSITVCLGVFVFKNIKSKKLNIVLLILFSWNLYEAHFFIKHGNKLYENSINLNTDPMSWEKEGNLYSFPYGLPGNFLPGQKNAWNNISPYLLVGVVNKNYEKNSILNNENYLINSCYSSISAIALDKSQSINPISLSENEAKSITQIELSSSGNYFICANLEFSSRRIQVQLLDKNRHLIVTKDIYKNNNELGMQIYINPSMIKTAPFTIFISSDANTILTIKDMNIIKYDPLDLPIRITSFTPFTANLITPDGNNYLEVEKTFFPGYKATLNGNNINVTRSEKHAILVPLVEGKNTAVLTYEGTKVMQYCFYVSLLTWALSFIYLLRAYIMSKFLKRKQ